jgi:hypothetical protein
LHGDRSDRTLAHGESILGQYDPKALFAVVKVFAGIR